MKPFIYIALDKTGQRSNYEAARQFADVKSDRFGFKLNLDAVLDFSPEALNSNAFVKQMGEYGKPLMVDLKMWNGGRTMTNLAKGCADLGVDVINMYPHAMGKFVEKVAKAVEGSKTKLFALTVLTHYTNEDTQRLYGRDIGDATRMLAELGIQGGAKGIIVPGTQLSVVKGFDVHKLVPAIRPPWYADKKANSQEQIVTHLEAADGGATHEVIGSPIMKSENPVAALERILKETDA